MKLKRNDIILFASVAAAAVIAILILRLTATGGRTAVVRVDGEVVGEYPLSSDTTIELGTNTLQIKSGAIVMVAADCPDKLCIKQGPADEVGESIVCLPNRVIVEIK